MRNVTIQFEAEFTTEKKKKNYGNRTVCVGGVIQLETPSKWEGHSSRG